MSKIYLYKKDNKYIGFKVKEHAGEFEKGENLVCAAISCLVQTTVNSIDENAEVELLTYVNENEAIIACLLPKNIDSFQKMIAEIVFRTFKRGMLDLQDKYPQYVKIKEIIFKKEEEYK